MRSNPDDFTPPKIYADYKYSPISSGVSPKIRLFVLFIALIICIYLIFLMILEK